MTKTKKTFLTKRRGTWVVIEAVPAAQKWVYMHGEHSILQTEETEEKNLSLVELEVFFEIDDFLGEGRDVSATITTYTMRTLKSNNHLPHNWVFA